jgi:hypothetical protein
MTEDRREKAEDGWREGGERSGSGIAENENTEVTRVGFDERGGEGIAASVSVAGAVYTS